MTELLKDALNADDDHVFMKPGDPIPRDKWDRPLIVPPDGGKPVGYRRCTTFVDVLESRWNLEQHMKRQVAIGIAKRPDLQLSVIAAAGDGGDLDKHQKKALNGLTSAAEEVAQSNSKSRIGTAIHTLTERVDRGEDISGVPEAYKQDLRAYWRATRPLEVVAIENFVVNDDLQVGGTFDRLVKYKGRHYIADVKTGNVDFGAGKIAMQLSVYSRSVRYDHHGPVRTPLPEDTDQEWGLVIHLPAGQGECTLKWIKTGKAWDTYIQPLLPGVWAYRSDKDWYVPFGE